MHVSGGVVTLGRGSLLRGNAATGGGSSIHVRGGVVTYTLPAPLGRWIYSSSSYETLSGAVDSEYPFPCAHRQLILRDNYFADTIAISFSPRRFSGALRQQ